MRKLLVVEDQGISRQARVQMLEEQSFEVMTAATAEAGIQTARQYSPDLILCSLDLSGGDNTHLLHLITNKSDLVALPIIVLTNRSDRDYGRQCATLGADDCLVTPFSDGDLLEAIAARLRKQDALTQRYNTLMRHTAERLNRLSHYDSLTDLPNHHLLRQRLMQAVQRAALGKQHVALLSISLDRLRQINNTLGYPAGDTLLRAAARRLQGILPRSSALARLTGNQFAIILPAPPDAAAVQLIAEDIIDCLSRSFSLPEQEVFVTTSIGIALFPENTQDISTLLRQADAALDWAKQQKSNYCQFYRSDMPVVSGDELQLETWLRYALKRQEFQVYYQPKQTLMTGRIEGAEALIRWRHPDHGYISPARFVPLAEETGLIVPIGEWVLRTVCEQAARWQQQGLPPVQVSVNLSSVQLNQPHLCKTLDRILKDIGLPAHHLQLEVTETALMQDVESALVLLHQFKDLGVQVALDDFGTGYASLGYLRQLPIDTLKIDTCFVRGVTEDWKNQIILRRIIALAHDLDLAVVAEGVEQVEEMELLKTYGCDAIQGYWVGLPMTAAELIQHL
ncbi:putative bifunctional diguanylate cyclase/phosphodiesterase [Leptolyngbya sp. PCC 6406]|uniref:putative bifunctional diguanylate cyclase/phosphodiesterase n=1 Tax=Leptolyngbya sp. PCC 6406 TaxID=1173264 RepID=UPI0002AC9AA3|nr:EAL domain-containing protein [Leptolyngbya sp. PCC 6406]